MGLLEKAQQRKQEIEAENIDESTIVEETRPSGGLLEKARQRKQEITTTSTQKKTKATDYLDELVWQQVIKLLENPVLIQQEIDRKIKECSNSSDRHQNPSASHPFHRAS